MAVAIDNKVSKETGSPSSPVTSDAFTIASNAVALVGYYANAQITGLTVTVGGQVATQIEDADSGRGGLFGVVGIASGSQTASIAWTGGTPTVLALKVITFTGAGATYGTAFTNEVNDAWASEASKILAITSNAGDLTCSCLVTYSNTTNYATDQTLQHIGSTSDYRIAMDTGPGTANPTHNWSYSSQWSEGMGINVTAAAGGASSTPVKMYHYKKRWSM